MVSGCFVYFGQSPFKARFISAGAASNPPNAMAPSPALAGVRKQSGLPAFCTEDWNLSGGAFGFNCAFDFLNNSSLQKPPRQPELW